MHRTTGQPYAATPASKQASHLSQRPAASASYRSSSFASPAQFTASSTIGNHQQFSQSASGSGSSWSKLDQDKCQQALDNLLYNMRRRHSEDEAAHFAQQRGDEGLQTTHAMTMADMEALHAQERNELSLITSALDKKDVVGLFSLLTVFWATRNQLARDVGDLERRLSAPLHFHHGSPAREPANLADVLDRARRRLDSMRDSYGQQAMLRGSSEETDVQQQRLQPHEEERLGALEWHAAVLEQGTFADVVQLSLDLQQEYQSLHQRFYNPFFSRSDPLAASGDATSSLRRGPDGAMQVQQEGTAVRHAERYEDLEWQQELQSLVSLVQTTLHGEQQLHHAVLNTISEHAAAISDHCATPDIWKFLLLQQSTSDSNDVLGGTSSGLQLLPSLSETSPICRALQATDGTDMQEEGASPAVLDPLGRLGGATLPTASPLPTSALWRVVKYAAVPAARGESLRHVLHRAYAATSCASAASDSLDSSRSSSLSAEQLSVHNLFCATHGQPLLTCEHLWLPPDPRLAGSSHEARAHASHSEVTNPPQKGGWRHFLSATAAAAASLRQPSSYSPPQGAASQSKRMSFRTPDEALDAVIRDDATVIVRVVLPQQGLPAAIAALAAHRKKMETSLLPQLERDLSQAKSDLWAAEIRSIEKTTMARAHRPKTTEPDVDVAELKQRITSLEGKQAHLLMAMSQGEAHLNALCSGNIAALSTLLLQSLKFHSAAEDLPERVIYVCKELPTGASLESFASAFGLSVEDLHVFEDFVPISESPTASIHHTATPVSVGTAAPSPSASAHRPLDKRMTRRTMVYLPVRVPVANTVEQDQLLVRELDEYAAEFPTLPPNTEVLEQLNALRCGDVNAISALLTTSRRQRKLFSAPLQHTTETLLQQLNALQEEVARLRAFEAHVREQSEVPPSAEKVEVDRASRQSPGRLLSQLRGGSVARAWEAATPPGNPGAPVVGISRGLAPADTHISDLLKEIESKNAEIITLRSNLKRAESAAASAASSIAHVKQQHKVAELEVLLDGLKRELHDETRRAVEATARCVQLEKIQVSLQNEVHAKQAALDAALAEVHAAALREKDLTLKLNDAVATANTAERDADAAMRAAVSHRVTYAAKEIPSGMGPAEFLSYLGVRGPAAEVSLQHGVVRDVARQVNLVYVPLKVDRAGWSVEDVRIQRDIDEVAKVLAAARQSAADRNTSHVIAHHSELLEQLAALRAGDVTALSGIIRSLRAQLNAILGQDDTEVVSAPQTPDALREEDDLVWKTVAEGRAKVTMLRTALREADSERIQWKHLCEEYQQASNEAAADVAALQDAKQQALQQRDAMELVVKARAKEIESLTQSLTLAEESNERQKKRAAEQRESAAREVGALQQHIVALEEAHASERGQWEQRVAEDAKKLVQLQEALEEMGVEIVLEEGH